LLVACSQPLLETYGCACAGRSYSAEELASYRDGAAKGDLTALAEMQEYHMWRSDEFRDTPAYTRERRQMQFYLDRRVALRDPDAIEEKVNDLITASLSSHITAKARLNLLQQARSTALLHADGFSTTDIRSKPREEIDVVRYLDREIRYTRERGPA
jgi:hypothetical protein